MQPFVCNFWRNFNGKTTADFAPGLPVDSNPETCSEAKTDAENGTGHRNRSGQYIPLREAGHEPPVTSVQKPVSMSILKYYYYATSLPWSNARFFVLFGIIYTTIASILSTTSRLPHILQAGRPIDHSLNRR
eukprot:2736182-Rhodomonas_salina.1